MTVDPSIGWGSSAANPLADIRAAIDKINNQRYEPHSIGPISPAMHYTACALLNVPDTTVLSEMDLREAAAIERQRMTAEQREKHDEALLRVMNGYR